MSGKVAFEIDADVLASLGESAAADGLTVTEMLGLIAEQVQAHDTRGRRDTLLEKVVRLYAAGWSDRRISAELYCSESTVRNKRRALGLPAHREAKATPSYDYIAREMKA